MTGIELAADSCVLVEVRRGKHPARLEAVHVINPSEWPPQTLAQVRRKKRLSRHAQVVAWTTSDTALRSLADAGFIVDTLVAPEQALGLLAAERSRPESAGATAWIALSRYGAAIVIAKGAAVLYSRRIEWHYKTVTRLNDQLLQRYTLVSHLAPELQHGMAVVLAQHGVTVDGAVTCGDLPDIRSLAMPLIEELDLEVETLDTLEGLDVTPAAVSQRAVDYAPALRLAAAVTALPGTNDPPRHGWWGRAAAAAVLLAAIGWWAVFGLPGQRARTVQQLPPVTPAPTATAGLSEPPIVPLIPLAAPPAPQTESAEPLPAVASILIGPNRRLAILNGIIVGEGDSVGSRRVVRIERDGVVLREAAGREVRVAVRRLKQASQR
jgi:hypothetical protein